MTKKKKILFLDDRSKRIHSALKKFGDQVTIVCTAKEAIKMLSNEWPWDFVYLDHDLCFEEFVDSSQKDCGMEVVRYLVEHKAVLLEKYRSPQWFTNFVIHSSNIVAAREMAAALLEAGYVSSLERWYYD